MKTTSLVATRATAGAPIARYGVRFGRTRDLVGVDSYAEASALYARARDASGAGCSRWPDARVYDLATTRVVARISYNAKVWTPGPWSPEQVALHDPYAVAAEGGTR